MNDIENVEETEETDDMTNGKKTKGSTSMTCERRKTTTAGEPGREPRICKKEINYKGSI